MKNYYDTFSTPLGKFTVALDESGAVVATAFGGVGKLRERFDPDELTNDSKRAANVRAQIHEFFAGKREHFEMRLSPSGTEFQKRVWRELGRIPFGETRSYGQLAKIVGEPKAARAVGRANATNPICLITPCHRVIGADGSLTGFAFGENLKRRLLEHEKAGRNGSGKKARGERGPKRKTVEGV